MDLDYQRYGRQIALREIGASGQRALAEQRVRFVLADAVTANSDREVLALACALHQRAGGSSATQNGDAEPTERTVVQVTLPTVGSHAGRAVVLGLAAWGAVEAARRVLGRPPSEPPQALLARLGACPVPSPKETQ